MSEPKPITKPTKTLSWQEFYTKTDNANKLMDRVWYCIACTEKDVALIRRYFGNTGIGRKERQRKDNQEGIQPYTDHLYFWEGG